MAFHLPFTLKPQSLSDVTSISAACDESRESSTAEWWVTDGLLSDWEKPTSWVSFSAGALT
jgi:hypothetical protein